MFLATDEWRRQESEVGGGQSWGGLGEAEKHDMNFALRITLVNAYCPFYS